MKKQSEFGHQRRAVIIVDDDVAVRNSLKFSLEVEGFAVRAYPDATELLNETAAAARVLLGGRSEHAKDERA